MGSLIFGGFLDRRLECGNSLFELVTSQGQTSPKVTPGDLTITTLEQFCSVLRHVIQSVLGQRELRQFRFWSHSFWGQRCRLLIGCQGCVELLRDDVKIA